MASLVCCMIKLRLPMGFVGEAFLGPLDVRRGVVRMKRDVKVHLPLSCLFFLMQKLFPTGWATLGILLCVDNGFRGQSCDVIQVVATVQNLSHK